MTERVRTWRPDWPCPVGQLLAQSRRGPGDPTYRIERSAGRTRHWRGHRTPEGPATLLVEPRPADAA
ncbi:MAG TPA: DNA-3-methyladenine glycosylase 2 family protein, partial [Nocardioides sp.]|nr:DNA-3-methyladenine glycosylase 2 family protein [Nocardioides sp.]